MNFPVRTLQYLVDRLVAIKKEYFESKLLVGSHID